MTCREKLKLECPNDIDDSWAGGCRGCPHHHGYLAKPADCCNGVYGTDHICNACWDREIPGTEPLTYEHATEPIGKVTDINENENGVTVTIEKEKNMATKKTKAELEKELETIKESKAELEKELKNLEKYKQYEDMAGEVHAIYMSFVMAGFSEEQAYDLLKTMIQNAGNITFNTAITPSYRSRR